MNKQIDQDDSCLLQNPYISLAKKSVETFVRTGMPLLCPNDLPKELVEKRAGVFTSLHEDGDLRGCIGTIVPVYPNIAEEIIANSIAACSEDPRFMPVQVEELDNLSYSVDILSALEPVRSIDDLDPKKYGVIVSYGSKRGLLLPNLDGVDSIEQQISIAMAKAGISPTTQLSLQNLQRFTVTRYESVNSSFEQQ